MNIPVVLRHCPRPDRYDRQSMPLPHGIDLAPDEWAREIFDIRHSGPIVKTLLGLRQSLVPLIGVPPTRVNPFRVRNVEDGEALIAHRERHLDFWCGVRGDGGALDVTTAVTLHGWRGRAYFVPVGVLHGLVTRAMMRRAVRRVARGSVTPRR